VLIVAVYLVAARNWHSRQLALILLINQASIWLPEGSRGAILLGVRSIAQSGWPVRGDQLPQMPRMGRSSGVDVEIAGLALQTAASDRGWRIT
jgi:hypothetical protein